MSNAYHQDVIDTQIAEICEKLHNLGRREKEALKILVQMWTLLKKMFFVGKFNSKNDTLTDSCQRRL